MNRYALGRNVAAFKRWFRFISAAMRRVRAPVHGSFRPKFQRLGLEDQAERNEAVATDVANGSLRKSALRLAQSVAGFGVVGLFGPRSGASCGTSPGSSRGGFG